MGCASSNAASAQPPSNKRPQQAPVMTSNIVTTQPSSTTLGTTNNTTAGNSNKRDSTNKGMTANPAAAAPTSASSSQAVKSSSVPAQRASNTISQDLAKQTVAVKQQNEPKEQLPTLAVEVKTQLPLKFNKDAFLAHPKIAPLHIANPGPPRNTIIATSEKLLELFSIMDDDSDGFVGEEEIDEIIFLVKSTHEEQVKTKGDTTPLHSPKPANEPAPTPNRASGSASPMKKAPLKYISPMASAPAPNGQSVLSPANNTEGGVNMSITSDFDVPVSPKPITAAAPAAASGGNITPKTSANKSGFITPGGSGRRTPKRNKFQSDDDLDSIPIVAVPSVDKNDAPVPKVQDATAAASSAAATVAAVNAPVEIVGPVPAPKKGFLISSPQKESRYHVLDSGVLYCMDSSSKTMFSIDRKGICLRGRKLGMKGNGDSGIMELVDPTIPEGNELVSEVSDGQMASPMVSPIRGNANSNSTISGGISSPFSPASHSGGEIQPISADAASGTPMRVIELKARNERERKDWIKALEDHIAFMDRNPNLIPGTQIENE